MTFDYIVGIALLVLLIIVMVIFIRRKWVHKTTESFGGPEGPEESEESDRVDKHGIKKLYALTDSIIHDVAPFT